MPFAPFTPCPGIDGWITREPEWPDEYERERDRPRPFHPGWAIDEDCRVVPCECCEGSGQIEEYPPRPTPHGPYARVERCGACGGSGLEEIDVELLTEDDLEEAFGP